MSTTVTGTRERIAPTEKEIRIGGRSGRGPVGGGNGPNGGGGGKGRDYGDEYDSTPHQYRVSLWIVLVAVLTTFVTLSILYFFRSGAKDWHPILMPRVLWLSTVLIIISSLTFERARKSLMHEDETSYRRWLGRSLLLGLAFLAVQLIAWRQLARQGVYLESDPHRSFFYLLTGAHGIHLIAGIIALSYLLARARGAANTTRFADVRRSTFTDVVGVYWHFMDGLWLYLFGLLFLWR